MSRPVEPNGRCDDCGAPVRFVLVIPKNLVAGTHRRRMPIDPDYDPATSTIRPSHAMNFAHTQARVATADEPPLEHEVPALTHFATCRARRARLA